MDKLIGSGIIFPITLNNVGRPDIVKGEKLIYHSILSIINWPTNSRFFNEQFGCRLEEVLEEPNDSESASLARFFIKESLEQWEKRIRLDISDIRILHNKPTTIDIQIRYVIRNTRQEETYVFPFYKSIKY